MTDQGTSNPPPPPPPPPPASDRGSPIQEDTNESDKTIKASDDNDNNNNNNNNPQGTASEQADSQAMPPPATTSRSAGQQPHTEEPQAGELTSTSAVPLDSPARQVPIHDTHLPDIKVPSDRPSHTYDPVTLGPLDVSNTAATAGNASLADKIKQLRESHGSKESMEKAIEESAREARRRIDEVLGKREAVLKVMKRKTEERETERRVFEKVRMRREAREARESRENRERGDVKGKGKERERERVRGESKG